MSLELEQGDEDNEDDGYNDVGNIGLPPSREYLQPRSRTLTQIAKLQVKLILHNTELDPETWVRIYAAKFRAIMDEDPSLTEFQIKHRLYFSHRLGNQTNTSPKRKSIVDELNHLSIEQETEKSYQ